MIADEVTRGLDAVVNLAAGLDTRPYRMTLPSSLRWVEVDLPAILQYKSDVLADERPTCALERVALDLAKVDERRALFKDVGAKARRTLVVSEGLLIYLSDEAVGSLAQDLAAVPGFERWLLELASPGLLAMMVKRGLEAMVSAGGASFQFAPAEGPAYFERLPFLMKVMSLLPQPKGPDRIWSGVCRFQRKR